MSTARSVWFAGFLGILLSLKGTLAEQQHPENQSKESPLDRLDRSQIPEYELQVAGGGHADSAPRELIAVLGDSRFKHWSSVTSLDVSPDGQTIATSCENDTVNLWDFKSGKLRRVLRSPDWQVSAVRFHPTLPLLISGTTTDRDVGYVRVWNPESGTLIRSVTDDEMVEVSTVAFSADGRFLAAACPGVVYVWEVATWKPRFKSDLGNAESIAVSLSPDGAILALAIRDYDDDMRTKLKFWDLKTGQERASLQGHEDDLNAITFSPDGRFLVSGDDANAVRVWEMPEGKLRASLVSDEWGVTSLCFSPDSETLVSGHDEGTVTQWDVNTGEANVSFKAHPNTVLTVAVSPDGEFLVSAGYEAEMKVWDSKTGQQRMKSTGHYDEVFGVAFSNEDRSLFSVSHDDTARIWNLENLTEERVLSCGQEGLCTIALSPAGKTFATGGWKLSGKLWELETGKELLSVQSWEDLIGSTAVPGGCLSVAFSPDGMLFAFPDSTGVRLKDLTGERPERTLEAELHQINIIAFSGDGKRLAVTNNSGGHYSRGEGSIIIWDVESGRLIWQIPLSFAHPWSVAFLADNKTVVVGGEEVQYWDVTTGAQVRRLDLHNEGRNVGLAISPDRRFLAVWSRGGRLEIREAQSGHLRHTLNLGPHEAELKDVAFSHDSRYLATANSNGTIYLLRLE